MDSVRASVRGRRLGLDESSDTMGTVPPVRFAEPTQLITLKAHTRPRHTAIYTTPYSVRRRRRRAGPLYIHGTPKLASFSPQISGALRKQMLSAHLHVCTVR